MKDVFKTLNAINVNKFTEKKNGLTYLSWARAWEAVCKVYPSSTYKIWKDEQNKPYIFDDKLGYMVYTEVTINELTHEMWLMVTDGANKAMKDISYTYQVADWQWSQQTRRKEKVGYIDKTVQAATMFDINTTIMRCLTKNLAMFGLGLYIYAGEDLPTEEEKPKKQPPKTAPVAPVPVKQVKLDPPKGAPLPNEADQAGEMSVKMDLFINILLIKGYDVGKIPATWKEKQELVKSIYGNLEQYEQKEICQFCIDLSQTDKEKGQPLPIKLNALQAVNALTKSQAMLRSKPKTEKL